MEPLEWCSIYFEPNLKHYDNEKYKYLEKGGIGIIDNIIMNP